MQIYEYNITFIHYSLKFFASHVFICSFMWSYFLPAPLYSSCALMPNDRPKRSQKPMLPVWTRCMT